MAWVALLFVPGMWYGIGFIVFAITELLVPVWAERAAPTTWHPDHIAERYGLFTIIVLGESVLAMSLGIQTAVEAGEVTANVIKIIVGGLLVIFSLWWFYFDWSMRGLLTSLRKAFIWGYGHLFVFASAVAVGAGLAVEIDYELHHAEIGKFGAGAAIAIPVAIFILVLWGLHVWLDTSTPLQKFLIPIIAFLILLTPLSGQAALLTGVLLVLLLVIKLVSRYRHSTQSPG